MSDNKKTDKSVNLKDFYTSIITKHPLFFTHQFYVYFNTGEPTTYGVLDSIFKDGEKNIKYYVKSSSVPAIEMTDQEVSFLSQKFVVPKHIKFGDSWDVKVLCTQDMKPYRSLLAWQNYYSDIRNNGGGNKTIPKVDAHVCLLDGTHQTVVKEIILKGVFPTNIPKIQMQYGNQSQIADFNCTFTYQYLYDKVEGDPLAGSPQ